MEMSCPTNNYPPTDLSNNKLQFFELVQLLRRKVKALLSSSALGPNWPVSRLSTTLSKPSNTEFSTMAIHIVGLEGFSIAATLFFAVAVLVILQRIVSNHLASKKYKFPPRIPGLPIVGNTFQLPGNQQGQWGVEQARKYGEM
jgi:hypothetical protein